MPKVERKEDRRVIRTRKALREALIELMMEQGAESITVKDIADRADVNRKTFYYHYDSAYEAFQDLENDVVAQFSKALEGVDLVQALKNPQELFARLNSIVEQDVDFYGKMLCGTGNAGFVDKVVESIRELVRGQALRQLPIEERLLDLALDYTVAGMIAVYCSWFEQGRPVPLAQLSQEVGVLTTRGMGSILECSPEELKQHEVLTQVG